MNNICLKCHKPIISPLDDKCCCITSISATTTEPTTLPNSKCFECLGWNNSRNCCELTACHFQGKFTKQELITLRSLVAETTFECEVIFSGDPLAKLLKYLDTIYNKLNTLILIELRAKRKRK